MLNMGMTPGGTPGVKENQTSTENDNTVDESMEDRMIAAFEEQDTDGVEEALAAQERQQAIDEHDDQVSREKFEKTKASRPPAEVRKIKKGYDGSVDRLGGINIDRRKAIDVWMARATDVYMDESIEHHDTLKADLELTGQELLRVSDTVCEEIDEQKLRKLKQAAAANGEDPDKVKLTRKTPKPERATAAVIVAAYLGLYKPVLVDGDVLCRYVDDMDDPAAGIYVPAESEFVSFAYGVSGSAFKKNDRDAMISLLMSRCPSVPQTIDSSTIVMSNGLFRYREQELHPFDPRFVALSKVSVAYNPYAESPVIQMDNGGTWEFEAWLADLADDDEETLTQYWQLIGASLRPAHPWGVAAIFYESTGRNGKGTLLELLRNLVGAENCASIDLAGLEKRFGRGRLLPQNGRVPSLVVSDENGHAYLEGANNFKKMCTHDPIEVEEKNRPVSELHWRGFIVQCINELPKMDEKNGSIYRRLLMVPFTKQFRSASDRDDGRAVAVDAIKTDYLGRQEVLEYVAKRALTHSMTPEYNTIIETAKSLALKEEQKINNDNVVEFWNEFSEEFTWDLLPWSFLHDLYVAWMKRFNPNGKPLSLRGMRKQLISAVVADPGRAWEWTDPNPVRHGNRMVEPEPLIVEYDLEKWVNDRASKNDRTGRSKMRNDQFSVNYRGLLRRVPRNVNTVHPADPVQAPPQNNVPVQAPLQNNAG